MLESEFSLSLPHYNQPMVALLLQAASSSHDGHSQTSLAHAKIHQLSSESGITSNIAKNMHNKSKEKLQPCESYFTDTQSAADMANNIHHTPTSKS